MLPPWRADGTGCRRSWSTGRYHALFEERAEQPVCHRLCERCAWIQSEACAWSNSRFKMRRARPRQAGVKGPQMNTAIALVCLAVTASPLHAQTLTPSQQYARTCTRIIDTTASTSAAGPRGRRRDCRTFPGRRLRRSAHSSRRHPAEQAQPRRPLPWQGRGHDAEPLLLLAHLDVVEALKADWHLGSTRSRSSRRTATSTAAASSTTRRTRHLHRRRGAEEGRLRSDRDIIVAFTADEEGGCCRTRPGWLFSNDRELVDASLVLNEGAMGFIRNGKPVANTIEATQRSLVVSPSRQRTAAIIRRCRGLTTRSTSLAPA